MSTVILRLVKENEKLETMAETVPRLIRKKEKLETMVETFFNGVACDDEEFDTTAEVDKDKAMNQKSEVMRIEDKNGIQDGERSSKGSNRKIQQNRNKRDPPTPPTTGVVAFYAYLSKDSSGPLSPHHILKFDVVSLNKGHGYNAFDGIFLVPTFGTYVFTWSIMSEWHGNVYSELMKNYDIIGTRYADSATYNKWDFSTGIVVVDVNQGDHVYVRLGRESVGRVLSVVYSRNTFSGWLLN